MGSIDTFQCGCIHSAGLERLRYFPRQLLTADDMRVEQEYFREKQRRHNRFMHGWGVVCGLLVQVSPKDGPLALTICPGYALGPCGDEIYVPEPVVFDLTPTSQLLAQPACANMGLSDAVKKSGELSIAIRYAECQTRPVRAVPEGCGCDDSSCQFSRIRDGFEIRAVPNSRELFPESASTLCEIQRDPASRLPAFPSLPSSDWVSLATVSIQMQQGGSLGALDENSINNNSRHILYSTEQIQQQLINSCPDS